MGTYTASQSDLVAVVPKNGKLEIRISLDTFSDYHLCNDREFYKAGDGTMRPGKGIAFEVDKLEAFGRRHGAIDGRKEWAREK